MHEVFENGFNRISSSTSLDAIMTREVSKEECKRYVAKKLAEFEQRQIATGQMPAPVSTYPALLVQLFCNLCVCFTFFFLLNSISLCPPAVMPRKRLGRPIKKLRRRPRKIPLQLNSKVTIVSYTNM